LRAEKTPSFKVNRKLKVWYDHATGEGGNLVDFGIRYFKCTVAELLQRLSSANAPSFSFHPQPSPANHLDTAAHLSDAGEKKESSENKIMSLG
jgi:DNA primase